MARLDVRPLGRKILLSIPETDTGSIAVEHGGQVQEIATVVAVGPDVDAALGLALGSRILYKSWGVDAITVDGEDYYFLDADGPALCSVIQNA